MLGYNYEQSLFNSIFTQRNGLIFEDVNNINLTNGSGSPSVPATKSGELPVGFSVLTMDIRTDT